MGTILKVGEVKTIRDVATTLAMIGACEAGAQATDQTWIKQGWMGLTYELMSNLSSQLERLEHTQNQLHPAPLDVTTINPDVIRVPRSVNWARNRDRYRVGTPCLICGKGVKTYSKFTHWVHVHDGGDLIVMDYVADTLDPAADCGAQPIGADCWRRHPELHRFDGGGQS